ncbi:MAG: glycosyltransferase family 2 protein [Dethiobacteria bacterium]|nr:glycosyltransferase [Bacillota bacterium]
MLVTVIPAQNEEKRIGVLLSHLRLFPEADDIVIILNGSQDNTRQVICESSDPRLRLLEFKESLGFDVPRAIGAKIALESGADKILFVDGDLIGNFTSELKQMFVTMEAKGYDLALTDCYPIKKATPPMVKKMLYYRQFLNTTIGYQNLGVASPSHGPLLISRSLLEQVPLRELAIPPVFLALAAKKKAKIGIATAIPHLQLGSSIKNSEHSRLITETIIGDCLEAANLFLYQKRHRSDGRAIYVGYHNERRFDILDNFLAETNS